VYAVYVESKWVEVLCGWRRSLGGSYLHCLLNNNNNLRLHGNVAHGKSPLPLRKSQTSRTPKAAEDIRVTNEISCTIDHFFANPGTSKWENEHT
jgi:hypothetical protein